MNRALRRCTIGILVLLSLNLASQEPKRALAVDALSVTVPFFALDAHGKPVGGVAQASLAVLDNKKLSPSILAVHDAKTLPLWLGVLIDTSKSESSSRLYRPALRAMLDFVNQALRAPEDRAFFVTFSDTITSTELMDREALQKFDLHLTSGGGTALYDAIETACKDRMQANRSQLARRVLLIVSDGGDNASHITTERAVGAAQQSGAAVFAVSTSEEPLETRGNQRLKEFAEQTGGHAFLHLRPEDIATVFPSIRDELDLMYAVTFVPPEGRDSRHSFEIKTTSNRPLTLRAPKGYYPLAGR